MKYLSTSCAAFDAGDEDEAARIAVVIRVLVHDTKSSTSLLTQLGLKAALRYLDTEHGYGVSFGAASVDGVLQEVGPRGLAHWDPASVSPRWFAPLSRMEVHERLIAFDNWWQVACITDESGVAMISRWRLVDWMAHQDGGAHVDPRGLDERYVRYLAVGDGSMWIDGDLLSQAKMIDFGVLSPVGGNGAGCAVRQVAYELEWTLRSTPETANML